MIIAIPVFGRLDMVKKCVASLCRCPEVKAWAARIILFPDFDDEMELLIREFQVERHGGNVIVQSAPNERLHAENAMVRARSCAFEHDDWVLTMDSDLVVVPTFLTVLTGFQIRLHQLCVVQSNISFVGTLALKTQWNGAYQNRFSTGTNHLMSRSTWDKLKPTFAMFANRWSAPPDVRDNASIRDDMANIAIGCNYQESAVRYIHKSTGTGHDAATKLACLWNGIGMMSTVVNYAVTIGDIGQNFTPQQFEGFRNVKLEELPAPSHYRHVTEI
jgi:hypothetical protein